MREAFFRGGVYAVMLERKLCGFALVVPCIWLIIAGVVYAVIVFLNRRRLGASMVDA